jgi:hypothetical protein
VALDIGEPDNKETSIPAIKELLEYRKNPEVNPVTFLSCSDNDENVEWMKIVEEAAPFCAEYDDYQDEKDEVLGDQDRGLPFTYGFWLIAQLIGALNTHDIDAMDEVR